MLAVVARDVREGGDLVAPAQNIQAFISGKGHGLPGCSYQPGVQEANLHNVLPAFVSESLKEGLQAFGRKIKGYTGSDGILVATESRTSSPVRIPRDATMQHPQVNGLYPCAEGAGYAGGIVRAAIDGMLVAEAVAIKIGR